MADEEEEAVLAEIDAYLDDPDVKALAEDLGRQFRHLPAESQMSELELELEKTQERLTWVLERVETEESAEVRLRLDQLQERVLEIIEGLRQRIIELQVDDPDS